MKKIFLLLLIFCSFSPYLNAQIITTIAGTGTAGYSGDGGPSISAQLNQAMGVAVDVSGNLYISDGNNNRIRKVSGTTGVITTVAGNGTGGYSGDGGLATSAQISISFSWAGIAVDASGNLYITDANNYRIRKVNATGVITTVAGNGTSGYSGDGGLATSAQLTSPGHVTVDGSGNLYISDFGNNTVRKVNGATGVITTIAGNGTVGYSGDGGAAISAQLHGPLGMAIDNSGNLYIADRNNFRVRKVNLPTGIITTMVGDGTSGGVYGLSVAVDVGSNNLYICGDYITKKVNLSTLAITSAVGTGASSYSGDGGPAVSATYANAKDVAIDNNNNLYIADLGNYRIRKVLACLSSITSPSVTSQTICQNGAATALSVSASGIGTITYQWYQNSTNSNTGGTPISGAMSTSYTPSSTTTGTTYYYAIITGTCGSIATNVSGAITVSTSTTITTQPSASTQTVCQSGTLTPLTVAGTGTGTLTYQWYKNAISSNTGGTFTGATTSTYTPSSSTPGTTYYYVTVTGCNTVTSAPSGAITVNAATAITTQPSTATQTVCQNGTVSSLSVGAVGVGLNYQWYSNTINSNSGGTPISGANAATYTPSSATVGTTYYYVVVSGSCGSAVNSVVSGAIAINPSTSISSQSTSAQTVCINGALSALSVTVAGTSLSYQWYSNTTASNSGGSTVSAATSSTYTPPSTVAGTIYYYVVVSGTCGSVTSAISGAITINPSTSISSQSTSAQTVCINGALSALSVTAAGTSLSYQWYSNTTASNSGGSIISTATSSSYTPSSGTVGITYYYVVVSGGCGSSVTSSISGAITINPSTSISSQSTSGQTVCINGTLTGLSVTAAGTGLSYQWYSNTTSSNSGGSSISGATSSSYTPSTTNAGTKYYYVVVSGTCGSSVTSAVSGAITVNPTTSIPSQSTSAQTVCQNGTLSALSVSATGASLSYQWYSNTSASNSGGSTIGGATSSSYTAPSTVAGTKYYYVIVSGACGTSVTSSVSGAITVNPAPTATIHASNGTNLCHVASTTLTVVQSGYSYSWSSSNGDYSGASQSLLVYDPETYTVAVSNSCGTSYASITVTRSGSNCVIARVAADGQHPTPPVEGADIPTVTEMTAFPNPAADNVTVAMPWNAKEDTQVQLFDMFGKLMSAGSLKKNEWKTDLSVTNCAEGLYIVRVGNGDLINAVKVMVVHK